MKGFSGKNSHSYGVLTIFNGTSLMYQQINSTDNNGSVIDQMTLTKLPDVNIFTSFAYLVVGIMGLMAIFLLISIVTCINRARALKHRRPTSYFQSEMQNHA